MIVRLVAVATLLLALGMAFAYWVVLPTSIEFLQTFDSNLYDIEIQAGPYYRFAAVMILTVGLLFELPILIVGLVSLGILSSDTLRHNRRIGYGLCIVAVVLLPAADFVSMGLQALPVVALFELSIWAAVLVERRAAAADLAPGQT